MNYHDAKGGLKLLVILRLYLNSAASIALGVAEGCMGAYILAHPELYETPVTYIPQRISI